jgi:hypothetical protein
MDILTGDVKKCPNCGELNPSSSTICHMCRGSLEKVESAEPGLKSPWGWTTLIVVGLLGTLAAAGILAGINWRRMGRPQLIWPTIIAAIVGKVGVIALQIPFAVSENIWMVTLLPNLVNVGIAGMLGYWQRGSHRAWKDTHPQAMSGGWGIPVVTIVGLWSVSGTVIGVAEQFL